MQWVAQALFAILALALGGCTTIYVMATEPTDLSAVRVGATRDTVEKTLGRPKDSNRIDAGTLDTYTYNHGRFPPGDKGDVWRAVVADITMAPIQPLLLPIYVHSIEKQKREVEILYGPDGTVVRIERIERRREAP